MRPRSSTTLITVLAPLLLSLAACKHAAPPAPTPPAPEVAVITVQPAPVPITYQFVGMTQASRTVEIRPRVAGFLLHRSFEEGRAVRAGDVLFEIDPRSFQADLEISQARQAQARARVALAQADVNRYTEAVSANAASKRELDQAQTELASALAGVNLAQAELDKSALNLSYTRITSPVQGTIGRALRDEGSYLDAGTDSLLAIARQTDPMYVTFPVSERDWLRWRADFEAGTIRPTYTQPDGSPPDPKYPDPPTSVRLLNGTAYTHPGRLSFFDSSVDPATGTAMARATFPNPTGELTPGQFVRITVEGWERPNSIVVPQRAVIQNPMGAIVMVLDSEDVVGVRPVTLGSWDGDGWLITTGLAAGDRVVADGLARARPGGKVRPTLYAPPSAHAPASPATPAPAH